VNRPKSPISATSVTADMSATPRIDWMAVTTPASDQAGSSLRMASS
jgi:hypothetical protein